jgi:hypothetical protein
MRVLKMTGRWWRDGGTMRVSEVAGRSPIQRCMMKDFWGLSILMHLCAVLTSAGEAEGLNFRNPWRNLRTRCQSTMSDNSNERTNQSQLDSRANLFYLLQTLAESAQARANDFKSRGESSVAIDQIEDVH